MGHGDHGHGRPYEIPNPEIYKVEEIPRLKKYQEELAKKGLKDPWLRNEAWIFAKEWGTPMQRLTSVVFRGFRVGLVAFLITIGVEQMLGKNEASHGHDEKHH